MSSLRRIAASHANGALSRGPVTRAGKSRSSLNAVRHGLLAKCVVLDNESRDGFDALLADFISRFGPVDSVELGLVEEMLSAFWRQRRVWAIETQIMGTAISQEPADRDELARITSAFTAESVRPQLELMHRYETRLHRMFQRALNNFILLRSLPAPVEHALACPDENTPEQQPIGHPSASPANNPVGPALACPDKNTPEQQPVGHVTDCPDQNSVGHALACPDQSTSEQQPVVHVTACPDQNPVGHALACPDSNPEPESLNPLPAPPAPAPRENIPVPNEPNPISGHLPKPGPPAAPPPADQKSSRMPAAGSTGNMLLNER